MNFVNKLGKICDSLGVNSKATYPVMLIAAVKGICRPTFTMMDKTESPETKKYTAVREGLTELIAIPTYWACGELTAYLATKMKFKNVTPDVHASLVKKASKNMMFLGVCTAALFVIPALCSVAIKPIMDKFAPTPKPPLKPVIKKPDINAFTGKKTLSSVYNTKFQTGMRVGGL